MSSEHHRYQVHTAVGKWAANITVIKFILQLANEQRTSPLSSSHCSWQMINEHHRYQVHAAVGKWAMNITVIKFMLQVANEQWTSPLSSSHCSWQMSNEHHRYKVHNAVGKWAMNITVIKFILQLANEQWASPLSSSYCSWQMSNEHHACQVHAAFYASFSSQKFVAQIDRMTGNNRANCNVIRVYPLGVLYSVLFRVWSGVGEWWVRSAINTNKFPESLWISEEKISLRRPIQFSRHIKILKTNKNQTEYLLVRKWTIPTDRPPLVANLMPNFADRGVSHSERNGFPQPLISVC
jgi:hypothetical protein